MEERMFTNQKIQLFQNLLDEFSKFEFSFKTKPQTLMQVSGYPHFENVCSNILSYLFTTDESHGLSDLFSKSLLEAANVEDSSSFESMMVEREVSTKKNNRIDLVLSNNFIVVGIENKLFSWVHNDLKDYEDTIRKIASEQKRHILLIVLSLRNESIVSNLNGYVNVTYESLFQHVRRNLGSYLDAADNTWIIYLKDFMRTIESLQR